MNILNKYPKLSCLVAGVFTSLAFLTHPILPALCLLGVLLIAIYDAEKPSRGGLYAFIYAMGFFIAGLYWVQNALGITLPDLPIARLGALIGLPLLLTALWILAGYLSVRFTLARSLARIVLFTTLLALAEYGRTFLMTGFPWNLFAYAWADIGAMIQLSAFGGVYLLNSLTIIWALFPAMLYLTWDNRVFVRGLTIFVMGTLGLSLLYGTIRLLQNQTAYRDDTAVVIVQPNIPQADKWDTTKMAGHFQTHVTLSEEGLAAAQQFPDTVKTAYVLWPETALAESDIFYQDNVLKDLVGMMNRSPFKTFLVTGLMRSEKKDSRDDYYNSIAVLSTKGNQLNMDDWYDKAHLVPFGEYIPLLDKFGIKAITGFSGFKEGPGPKILHGTGFLPAVPLVCYEAIFPGAIKADDDAGNAQWIMNASNDGWYGDTTGPHQHLAMTRFRAVEQGLPVLRTTTTGVSAVIDSYGRVLEALPYGTVDKIATLMPMPAFKPTMYRYWHNLIFFMLAAWGIILTIRLKPRKIYI